MIAAFRKKCNDFVNNNQEYPVLAGFSIGFYMILFYYSNNLELFSWIQFFSFLVYYIAFPIVTILLVAYILNKSNYKKYRRQGIFIATMIFLMYFILENIAMKYSFIKVFLVALIGIFAVSFWIKNYKAIIILVLLMTVFPMVKLGTAIARNFSHSGNWNQQPDDILNSKFTKSPNVYFIQIDGYANNDALSGKLCHYDNSRFDQWLQSNHFTLYDDFRSNYSSTLKSNSSCFNMKHHYSKENSITKTANDYILDENPVLEIFKNNGYKTFFLTERPYFMSNRPKVAYDFSNFSDNELPFFKDNWSLYKEIGPQLKKQIANHPKNKNFFFVQKLTPSHVSSNKFQSFGIEAERKAYLKRLEETNVWIKDIVSYIDKNDPNAIVILGADHGSYVGFSYTGQAFKKITDKDLLLAIFGAKMAIRWNDDKASTYAKELKTSVNLFRILFAFMSEEKKYLENLQPDESYNFYDADDHTKIYKAL